MKFKGKIPHTKNVGFNNNFHKINEIGLNKAYESDKKVYVDGDSLFIAGTSNKQDVIDDFTKIPFYGNFKKSQRYMDVDNVLKNNPNVKNVIGHSLGGSVALELEKNNPNLYKTTTYGAPVISLTKGRRFRHSNDLISSFDLGAKTVGFDINPLKAHSYSGYV
jgi:hypothetical protein